MSTSTTNSNLKSAPLWNQCQSNRNYKCGTLFAQLERDESRQNEYVNQAVETTAPTADTVDHRCAKTREEIHREKNRMKSRKARKRKKCMIEEMEKSLKVTVAHNHKLRQENMQLYNFLKETSALQGICSYGRSYAVSVPEKTLPVTEQVRGNNGMLDKDFTSAIVGPRFCTRSNIPLSCDHASKEQDLLQGRCLQEKQATMPPDNTFAGDHVPISSKRRLNQEHSVPQSSGVAHFLQLSRNPFAQCEMLHVSYIMQALQYGVCPTTLDSVQTNNREQLFEERSRIFGSCKNIPKPFVPDQEAVTKDTGQSEVINVHPKRSSQRRL